MKQETTLEEAAIIYAHKSFIWPLNKQGEKQSIPPGQIVPPGYAKHQKIATKHFTAGYKSAQENSNINALEFEIAALKSLIQDMDATIKSKYSEEDMKQFGDWCRNGLLNTEYGFEKLDEHLEQWKQFKNK